MSAETAAGERVAIGIAFGNSSSSIAFTNPVSFVYGKMQRSKAVSLILSII
jgi:hypothetical protein